jgi:group I intron endonuclease
MPDCGVYMIVNLQSGKVYIGSSVNLKNRIYNHKWSLKNNSHPNKHLQASWNKYGEDVFRFVVIERVDNPDKVFEREQYYLDLCETYFRHNGYNISERADAAMQAGGKHGIETVIKMICVRRPRGRSMERCYKVVLPDGEKMYLPRKYDIEMKRQIIDFLLEKYDGYFTEYWDNEKTKVCLDIFAQYLIDVDKKRSQHEILSRHKMDEMINGSDYYVNFSDMSIYDLIRIGVADNDEDERSHNSSY